MMLVTHPNGARFVAPPEWMHYGTFIKWGWNVSTLKGVRLSEFLDAAREVAGRES